MLIRDEIITWLLEGPAWVQYRTRLELLDQQEANPEVQAARREMLADPNVQSLITEVSDWPGPILKAHNDASHLLHKLTFLADLGLRLGDPGIQSIIDRVLNHQSPEGPFQVLVNIRPQYGGRGVDQLAWMLCDAPLVVYDLILLGFEGDPRLQLAIQQLTGLIQENGWPCAVSPDLGKFRGPGRKSDPCPYATLLMLQMLAALPDQGGEAAHSGVEALLSLWNQRKARKPYLFGIGSDYIKLKAPLIWYDLLHVLDVLSRFPWAIEDPRLQEMQATLAVKSDRNSKFSAESIWMAWKGWEFAQKKAPSRWITFLALRQLKRMQTNR